MREHNHSSQDVKVAWVPIQSTPPGRYQPALGAATAEQPAAPGVGLLLLSAARAARLAAGPGSPTLGPTLGPLLATAAADGAAGGGAMAAAAAGAESAALLSGGAVSAAADPLLLPLSSRLPDFPAAAVPTAGVSLGVTPTATAAPLGSAGLLLIVAAAAGCAAELPPPASAGAAPSLCLPPAAAAGALRPLAGPRLAGGFLAAAAALAAGLRAAAWPRPALAPPLRPPPRPLPAACSDQYPGRGNVSNVVRARQRCGYAGMCLCPA